MEPQKDDSDDSDKIQNVDDDQDNIDFAKWFIIDGEGFFAQYWKILNIISCVSSSYIYAWISAFGDD